MYSTQGNECFWCGPGEIVNSDRTGCEDCPAVMTYSDLLGRIADENYLVIGLDHLKFPNYPVQGQDFHDLLEWAGQGSLVTELASQGIKAVPDVANRAVVMG